MSHFPNFHISDRCSPFVGPKSDWGLLIRLLMMGAFGWKKSVWLRCQTEHRKYLQNGLLLNQNETSVAQANNGLLATVYFYVQCYGRFL